VAPVTSGDSWQLRNAPVLDVPEYRRYLLWILAVALVLRVVAAILMPDQNFPDAASYRQIAFEIGRQHRFVNPYVMPLYPLIVSVTGAGWGQLCFDIAVSVATVYLVYALTLAVASNQIAALYAAVGTAIYPYFIFYSVVGLTETLFIALLITGFLAWYHGRFTTAAVFIVLCILTRPTIDLLPPLLIFYFALVIHQMQLGTAVRHLAIYALIYCALLAPWWLHNYHAYGSFVRLNLGGGQALYSGNNPRNQTGGVSDVTLDMERFDRIADPVARDHAARDAAVEYITEDPIRFIKLAGLKFLRFWRLWPFATAYSGPAFVILSIVSFLPVLVLALVYVVTCGPIMFIRIAPIGVFIGYLTLVHMILVGSIRYRLPIEPFLIALASLSFSKIVDVFRWSERNRNAK
jgi:hypothetical protein